MNEIYETEQSEEIVASIPDETGLNNHQKVALIGAWSLVKKDIISHGRNIFVRFFEEHPQYLNYFDFSQDKTASEIGENKSLHAHALNVMHFIGKIFNLSMFNLMPF
uniref:Myoglobin n=1 Tax=Culex pipiens TaxID=7175 RepID=A0A8D8FYI7_CULPI